MAFQLLVGVHPLYFVLMISYDFETLTIVAFFASELAFYLCHLHRGANLAHVVTYQHLNRLQRFYVEHVCHQSGTRLGYQYRHPEKHPRARQKHQAEQCSSITQPCYDHFVTQKGSQNKLSIILNTCRHHGIAASLT